MGTDNQNIIFKSSNTIYTNKIYYKLFLIYETFFLDKKDAFKKAFFEKEIIYNYRMLNKKKDNLFSIENEYNSNLKKCNTDVEKEVEVEKYKLKKKNNIQRDYTTAIRIDRNPHYKLMIESGKKKDHILDVEKDLIHEKGNYDLSEENSSIMFPEMLKNISTFNLNEDLGYHKNITIEYFYDKVSIHEFQTFLADIISYRKLYGENIHGLERFKTLIIFSRSINNKGGLEKYILSKNKVNEYSLKSIDREKENNYTVSIRMNGDILSMESNESGNFLRNEFMLDHKDMITHDSILGLSIGVAHTEKKGTSSLVARKCILSATKSDEMNNEKLLYFLNEHEILEIHDLHINALKENSFKKENSLIDSKSHLKTFSNQTITNLKYVKSKPFVKMNIEDIYYEPIYKLYDLAARTLIQGENHHYHIKQSLKDCLQSMLESKEANISIKNEQIKVDILLDLTNFKREVFFESKDKVYDFFNEELRIIAKQNNLQLVFVYTNENNVQEIINKIPFIKKKYIYKITLEQLRDTKYGDDISTKLNPMVLIKYKKKDIVEIKKDIDSSLYKTIIQKNEDDLKLTRRTIEKIISRVKQYNKENLITTREDFTLKIDNDTLKCNIEELKNIKKIIEKMINQKN